MLLRADFSQREVVFPQDHEWSPSPAPGVERMMLDRVGDEVARATSLVRYAPNASFPVHTHGGGEEILVLEGEFQDEQGSYPKGTYLRNPIGTSHAPRIGDKGALIFVKLHQFSQEDTQSVRIETQSRSFVPGLVPGLTVLPLHQFGTENVALVKWQPNTEFQKHTHYGGEEILVLEGVFHDEKGSYPSGTWIRSPHLSQHTPFTKAEGALIWVKTGHLIKN